MAKYFLPVYHIINNCQAILMHDKGGNIDKIRIYLK